MVGLFISARIKILASQAGFHCLICQNYQGMLEFSCGFVSGKVRNNWANSHFCSIMKLMYTG